MIIAFQEINENLIPQKNIFSIEPKKFQIIPVICEPIKNKTVINTTLDKIIISTFHVEFLVWCFCNKFLQNISKAQNFFQQL